MINPKDKYQKIDMVVQSQIFEMINKSGVENIILACMPYDSKQYFDDDVIATCEKCHKKIRHRPWIPICVSTVCIQCVSKLGMKMEG